MDGVWLKGWNVEGDRVVVWQHCEGGTWAWKVCPSAYKGFLLQVRPVGKGETLPRDLKPWHAPAELIDWAKGSAP